MLIKYCSFGLGQWYGSALTTMIGVYMVNCCTRIQCIMMHNTDIPVCRTYLVNTASVHNVHKQRKQSTNIKLTNYWNPLTLLDCD